MRTNPRDWALKDVEAVCRRAGIEWVPPKRGSHYKIFHPRMEEILTIPAHRPIKPVYIRKLVQFIDALEDLGD